jgi:hypothetical protein
MKEKFKQEAEKRYPDTENCSLYEEGQINLRRLDFISGCEFGYKEGIEEGMKFGIWLNEAKYDPDEGKYYQKDTAELFELFKQEQYGK